MPGMGTTVGLIKSLAKVNPEDVKSSVEDWLDDHPEATTTVQDGSITREKLHSDLQDVVDEVDEHSDEIGELTNFIVEELQYKNPTSVFTFAQGTIRATDGYIDVGNTKGLYTPSEIYLNKDTKFTIPSTYELQFYKYSDAFKTYEQSVYLPLAENGFYRIVIRKTDSSDITLSEASNLIVDEKPWIGEISSEIEEVKTTADKTATHFGVGKNIVDTSKLIASGTGSVNSTTGEYSETGGSLYLYGLYNMEVGATYTLSKDSSYCYLYFYNADGSYAGVSNLISVGAPTSVRTFVCAYPIMLLAAGKSNAEQLLQIEKGGTASSYVPYYVKLSSDVQIMGATLINKKVLVIGDSISTGDTSAALYPGEKYGEYNKWVEKLVEDGFFAATGLRNDSIHATGYVAEFEQRDDDYVHRIKAISNPSSYDWVIINGCYNDWGHDVPLQDFKDAVDEFYAYLVTHFTQAHICVMNSLPSFRSEYTNQIGLYQKDYNDYVKEVAEKYALPFYDLFNHSGFYPKVLEFRNMWTYDTGDVHDGVHPTKAWCDNFMAPLIKKFVSQYI